MKSLKTIARKTILKHSKYLTVENHVVQCPDGSVIDDWAWIVTPNYITVATIDEGGMFICFRQTKYTVDGTSLAPVGGIIEDGEEPLAAAKRELLEETGYEASEWRCLGTFPVDANRGAGNANLFLATGARKVAAPDADDLEEQELLRLTREEVGVAVSEGEFKSLSWTAVMALALLAADE